MKKWIALVLSIFLLLSLASCGKAEPKETEEETKETEQTETQGKEENDTAPTSTASTTAPDSDEEKVLHSVKVISELQIVTEEDVQVNIYNPYKAVWITDDLVAVYTHYTLNNGTKPVEAVLLYTENGRYIGMHQYNDSSAGLEIMYMLDPALRIFSGDDVMNIEFMEGDDHTFSDGTRRIRERDEKGNVIRDVIINAGGRTENIMDANSNLQSSVITNPDGELVYKLLYTYTDFPVPEK